MESYKQIPVAVAKQIADDFDKNQVIIIAWDAAHQLTHTTTFGKTAFDKENAAAAGEKCSAALGCDLGQKQEFENFHADYDPAIYKEAMDLLRVIYRRQGTTGPQLQEIERLLRAAGDAVRRA